MGQKVNPISLRLERTNRHFDSCWYDDYNYTGLLLQDLKIKSYFKTVLEQIQYPEGRLSIENLPKKTNINLFYYNPTNARRKKNIRFQLQDYKKKSPLKKDSLYRNKRFILFQPGIERKNLWKNSLTRLDYRFFGKDFNEYGLKRNTLPRKERDKVFNSPQLNGYTLFNPFLLQTIPSFIERGVDPFGVLSQQRKEQYCGVPSLSVSFATLFNPFQNTLSYKSGNLYDIKKLFLEFILYTPKPPFLKKDFGRRWVKERFFVRYLLCFFYCKFLQNKNYMFFNTLYAINNVYNSDKSFLSLFEKTEKKKVRVPANFHKHPSSGLYSRNDNYKSHLEFSLCKQYNTVFTLFFFRSLSFKQGANFLVQEIIYYLERKIPFRRIKTSFLREIPRYKRIKGVRISCSGRVGGRSKKAQRSKTQSVKIGQTSLGVFSSKIDFACKSAKTRFGLIGVKVWICYQ